MSAFLLPSFPSLPPSLPYLPLSRVLRMMAIRRRTWASVSPSWTALKMGFSYRDRGKEGGREGGSELGREVQCV
jgi:hypothetical protein